MTYVLTADLHLHAWDQFSKMVDDDGELVNNRLKWILDEFDRACITANKEGAKHVIIAGDLFHVRGSLKTSVLNYATKRLRQSARLHGVQVIIIPGNHDLEGAEVTSLGNAAFSLDDTGDWDREDQSILVVPYPDYFEEPKVALLPWQNTRAGIMEALDRIRQEINACGDDPKNVDLIMHTGINGVLIGMPDHGWSPEEMAGWGFKRVFSGHYHHHKVFDVNDTPIVSIGATTHQTWSDVNTKAGFLVVEDTSFEWHETKAPKFIDFLDIKNAEKDIAGNYVRIKGIEADEAELKQYRADLLDEGAAGVIVQSIARNKVVTRNGASSGSSVRMETSVVDWIKNAKEVVDVSDELEREALDILAEARSR